VHCNSVGSCNVRCGDGSLAVTSCGDGVLSCGPCP
jgi:hypothetical protein